MTSQSLQKGIPAVLALCVFGVYLSTVCPTVYLGDSGELTAAAFCLGIAHNSGYPLYALLGKLFSWIPFGHIGFRLNLMSVAFAVLAVWLVYSFVLKTTSSQLSALIGALVFAFTPILWSQTVSAEVYALHVFFVALLIRLLWWWDETRRFCCLAIVVFVTGISFGNHMQTVILAPAVLLIILSADYKTIASPKNFFFLFVLFVFALCLYMYLPIRTEAGAAIHWGDPNTLERFVAHVTAHAHRKAYVLTKSSSEYLLRAKEVLWFVGSQFGLVLCLAFWGWLKLSSVRWRFFFVAVIVFDLVYSVFFNIISLQITPFGLASCVVLAMLVGMGTAHIIRAIKDHPRVGNGVYRGVGVTACAIAVMPMAFNYDLCDQSQNYTAYEHATNIFRTVDNRATLFLDGDNNIFPVTYGRIVERMREDVTLYDRPSILFKMPRQAEFEDDSHRQSRQGTRAVEKGIIQNKPDSVYYGVFNPAVIPLPDRFAVHPYGILYKVMPRTARLRDDIRSTIWAYYVTESINAKFSRDYMNREVSSSFQFALGKYFLTSGKPEDGIRSMQKASSLGYDDTTIHSEIAVFLTDQGFFEQARQELEKALVHYEDLSGVYNNWGYYYHKLGDQDNAVIHYSRAIELRPENHPYYNNLGLALYDASRKDEAAVAFRKSLTINMNQPKLKRFMKEHDLQQTLVE